MKTGLLRLPALLLSALLQLAPLLRVASTEAAAIASPIVAVLRWLAGASAVAGSFHAVSAATGLIVTGTTTGTNGVTFAGARAAISSGEFGAAQSYSASGLPPGLTITRQGVITGKPTTTGVFNSSVTGWQKSDTSGFNFQTILKLTIVDQAEVIITNIAYLHALQDNVNFKPTDTTNLFQVEGIVTTFTNLTSGTANALFYFQDDTAGISVFWAGGFASLPAAGTKVRVVAPLISFNGLLMLTPSSAKPTTSVTVLTTGNPRPTPVPLDFGWLNDPLTIEAHEGQLVIAENATLDQASTAGIFASGKSITMTAADGISTIALFVNAGTDLVGQGIPAGPVNVIGVLGQFDSSDPRTSGYQIIPSRYADVVLQHNPPTISQQPTNATVAAGSAVQFRVTATGTAPLTYQWAKDGGDLATATAATLNLANVQTNQAGGYSVVIANAYGSITSSVVALTVNQLSQTITFGALGNKLVGDAPFTVSATSSSGLPVSLSLVSGPATLSGNTLTLTGPGTVTVRASQAGDSFNRPALFARSFTVSAPGTVVAWGYNEAGQTTVPAGLSGVTAIAAGFLHTVALRSNGTVVVWGSNGGGQANVPVGLSEVTAIAAGYSHTVALKRNGTVVAWGANNYGQTTVPVGLSGVTAVAAGESHTVALKSDGTVVAWGGNNRGELNIPAGLSEVTAIATGDAHTVALKSDGSVVAWGLNNFGQTTVPAGLSGVTAIAGGGVHTVAVKGDGTLVAWGAGAPGLTGDPHWGQSTVPAGLSGVTAVAAGYEHTLALKSDGTVVAWGRIDYGPTTVPAGLSGVTAIAAGRNHTVALKREFSPVITTQPISLTVNRTESATFNVTATGTAPLIYQWTKDGNALPGATSATLTLNTVQPPQIGDYRVVVGNAFGSVTSSVAALNITGVDAGLWKGLVAYYPFNGNANDETGISTGITANNVVPVSNRHGETGKALFFAPGQNSRFAFANPLLPTGSAPMTVALWMQIQDPKLPPVGSSQYTVFGGGSDAANRWDLHLNFQGNGIDFSPDVASFSSAGGYLGDYSRFSLFPDYPTALRWHQLVVSFRSATETALFLDGKLVPWERPPSATTSSRTAGLFYLGSNIIDQSFSGSLDDVRIYNRALSNTEAAALYSAEAPPPVITTQPTAITVNATATATFSVTATGAEPLTYQWRKDGVDLATATAATLNLANVQTNQAGGYSVVIANAYGSITSSVVALTVNPLRQTITFGALGNKLVGDAPFTVNATSSAGLPVSLSLVSGPATLSGNLLTLTGPGTVTVRASQAGNAVFSPALFARSFTVSAPGTVVAWGRSSEGQTTVPVGLSGVTAMAGGYLHTVALKRDGTVLAWGQSIYGQASVPVGLSGVTAISAGYYHSVALKSDGTVVAWGAYDPNDGQATVPAGLSGVAAIAAGGKHTVALKSDGTVVAWGLNNWGQTTVPAGLSGVTAIAAGVEHTVALRSDGTVVAWGYGGVGQTTIPVGLSGVTAIAANNYQTVALKSDGTVVAWGDSSYGVTTVPAGLSGVTAIAAGFFHSVALKSDGTMVAWGSNGEGQTTIPAGLSGVTAIAAGGFHTVALKSDPVIFTAPTNTTLLAGQTLTLSAQIAGFDVALRWQKDETNLTDSGRVSGAASQTLTITGLTLADAGLYRLTGTNAYGNAVTAAATVTVQAPPTITQEPQSVAGVEGDHVILSVTASGAPLPTYQWFKNGQPVAGATGATLEFASLVETNAASYRVVVSNPVGNQPSAEAVVTYTPAIRVLVDGVAVTGTVRSLNPVTVELQFANPDWFLFYTLDGSEPTFASDFFLSPFVIAQAADLRVVAYAPDFSAFHEGRGVSFRFLQPQTIQWGALPALRYLDRALLGVTASSGLPVALSVVSGPALLAGQQLTATGAGDVVLRAVQAGNDQFAPVTVERTLTVAKAPQVLTWPTLANRTFGEAAFGVTVTANSGLPVTLSVNAGKAQVNGTNVTLTGAGPVTLAATQTGTANYAAVAETRTFQVAQAEQTIIFPSVANRPYRPEPFTPVATTTSGLSVSFEVLSGPAELAGGAVRLTGIGSVILRATQPGNDDYRVAVPVDRTFTVSQGTQTLSFTAVGPKTFGDAPVTLGATSTAGLPVTFRVLSGPGSVAGDALTLNGAGSVVVQALQAGTTLYAAATASQTVVVAKAVQTLNFATLPDLGYTTNALTLSATVDSGLPVGYRVLSGAATVTGAELRLTGVGGVAVAADQPGNTNWLAVASVTNTFTVSRGGQTITFAPVGDQILGHPPVSLSATSSSGLPVGFQVLSGPATLSGSLLTLLNEGTVTVRARQVGSPLYLATQTDQTFAIRKLTSLTVTVADGIGGTVKVEPVQDLYAPTDTITLTAQPGPGYEFAGWSGALGGNLNPSPLLMSANRSVTAAFKDVAAPTFLWDLPVAGPTGDERARLTGRVTDNRGVASAQWARTGEAAQVLALDATGAFAVNGLLLRPGTNAFTLTASDAAGNVSTVTRVVVWVPVRTLAVPPAAEVQEGQRLVFAVDLSAPGDVAGLTFTLGYDPVALTDPQVEWGALTGQSVNNVNLGTAGRINGSFALAGTALPVGTNRVANVSFRARSVPGVTDVTLTPAVVSVSGADGAALGTGNAAVAGNGRIKPRRFKGDNNANQRLDIGDAVVLSRLQVGLDEVRPWDVALNDLNESADLDSGDVVRVLRAVVGLDPQPKRTGRGPRPAGAGDAVNTNDVVGLEFPDGPVAPVGQPYRVVVRLARTGGPIAGINFTVGYPLSLNLSSRAVGALVPADALPFWNESPGSLRLAAVRSTVWPGTSGVVAVLTFTPTAEFAAQAEWPLSLTQAEVTGSGFDIRPLDDVAAVVRSLQTVLTPARVTLQPNPDGTLDLAILAPAGAPVSVESGTDLSHWTEFQRVTGLGETTPVHLRLTPQPGDPARFWRAVRN